MTEVFCLKYKAAIYSHVLKVLCEKNIMCDITDHKERKIRKKDTERPENNFFSKRNNLLLYCH